MSLSAGLSLLLNPVMFSAPKVFQAHFILLVSDAIHISMSSENKGVDPVLIDFYLTAFEMSVILYTRYMCNLQNGYPISGNNASVKSRIPENNPQLDFESHLLPATWKKICHLITKCEESWRSYLCSRSLGEKSNLLTNSIAYVKESLRAFDMSCTDEMLSILSCIILRGSSDDIGENVLYTDGKTSVQDIYLLASILKLMSCSILQVIHSLRHGNNSSSSEALKEASLYKEFDVVMDVIGCFEKFNITLPVQKFLLDIMEAHPSSHMKSKWMLLHFSGLLSLSYVSGIDFLVNDCIFAMISVLNIFSFEEGSLHVLGPLIGSKSKSSVGSSGNMRVSKSSGKVRETFLMDKKSSKIVASKFVKIRTLYLGGSQGRSIQQAEPAGTSENASFINCIDSAVGMHEETCNGENFLKCIIGRSSLKSSEIDDLADFIECKRGKDYSGWLKGRQKFRQWWKKEKMAAYQWNKKRKAWRCMIGKKA
ncbi:uncharacterized protein LOC110825527 [Carica papaya]|uniref:uncharacterized protein LOC110825527 n=1 Tax=Carica papaya TaxID=3649 RepID=UPI000B8C7131|nr:uncharacterized protein LOC110825527 [Carica papaya]